jgi:hypothetical protein
MPPDTVPLGPACQPVPPPSTVAAAHRSAPSSPPLFNQPRDVATPHRPCTLRSGHCRPLLHHLRCPTPCPGQTLSSPFLPSTWRRPPDPPSPPLPCPTLSQKGTAVPRLFFLPLRPHSEAPHGQDPVPVAFPIAPTIEAPPLTANWAVPSPR